RFAFTLTGVLNDMASEGWEYLRAETLPSEERSGLTSRTTVWHNVLVFRRALKPVSRHDDQTRARDAVPPAPVATPTPVSAPTTPVSATP
ncbi:hypothetical protein, partial [Streptomyces sp. P17]|uniref:hypothetical protein n=1 Tax=Streptomyces sp. P17 TaxID=3074716 RepID=UPI0028F4294C